jgi:hypothetical protein
MRAIIGARLLASSIAQPEAKPFEIYDTRLPGFALRVQPSGVRSYYARFGRNRRISLGKVGELLPDEAHGKCQKALGNVAHGRHPLSGLFGPDGHQCRPLARQFKRVIGRSKSNIGCYPCPCISWRRLQMSCATCRLKLRDMRRRNRT